jgi:hypothetical protein
MRYVRPVRGQLLAAVAVLALALSASLLTSVIGTYAEAHGPCVCTAPAGSADQRVRHAYKKALVQAATTAPGKTLEVESRAIQAIWNPPPSELGNAAGGGLSDLSWRRADQPTVTVFDNQPAVTDRATRRRPTASRSRCRT